MAVKTFPYREYLDVAGVDDKTAQSRRLNRADTALYIAIIASQLIKYMRWFGLVC